MSIKDWPAQERPREKLLEHGAQALTDAELLAIFLCTGRMPTARTRNTKIASSTPGDSVRTPRCLRTESIPDPQNSA